MRYFFIILLGVIPFFAPAQDVIIPSDVARYFLEESDRAKILTKKDSLNQEVISGLGKELEAKQEKIETYKADSLTFRSILANKDQEIGLVKEDLSSSQKVIKKQRLTVNVLAGVTSGVVIGSAVPAIGTVIGGLVGGATGCIIYLFKRK